MPATQGLDLSGIPDADPAKMTQASSGLDLSGIPDAPAAATAPEGALAQLQRESLAAVGRFGRGVVRQGVADVQRVAAPIRSALGMQPATPPPEETTTAGTLGRGAGQLAEFYGGGELASGLSKVLQLGPALKARGLSALVARFGQAAVDAALQGGAAAGVATAQGDQHPGRAAALGAAGPVAGAVGETVAPALAAGAKAGVGKVLQTGLRGAAADATEAPQLVAKAASTALDQGLSASWPGWKQATLLARRGKGQELEALLAGPAGSQLVDKTPVIDALDKLIDTQATHLVQGAGTVVYNKPLLGAVREIKQTLQKYGGTFIEARQLHDLKSLWDTAVFGGKEAGAPVMPLADRLVAADRLARKTATNAIRSVFDSEAPSISDADEAVSRVIKLNQLVKKAAQAADTGGTSTVASTVGRKTSQAVVGTIVGEEAGRRSGTASGIPGGGVVGGAIGAAFGAGVASQIDRVLKSPGFKLAPAYLKQQLAEAVVSGKAAEVRRALGPLVTSMAAGSRPSNPNAGAGAPATSGGTTTPQITTGSPR